MANGNKTAQQKPDLNAESMVAQYFMSHGMSEDQQNRAQAIQKGFEGLALLVLKNTHKSADQTAAIRKMREASMTLVQSIALEEVGK